MLKGKIMGFVAAGALVMGVFAPSAFADVNVSGNGAYSQNNVSVAQKNSTNIQQQSTSNFTNNVGVWQNTGGNVTKDNTGGNVSVKTGDASSYVNIQNKGGSNYASLPSLNCGCNTLGNVWVSGNGYKSYNTVTEKSDNSLYLNQKSTTNAYNKVSVNQNTGNNYTSGNTSGQKSYGSYGQYGSYGNKGYGYGGGTTVSTGDATSGVSIKNAGGSNGFQVN